MSGGSGSEPGGAMELTVERERVRELSCSLTSPDSGEVVSVKLQVDTPWSFQELERAQRDRLAPPPEEPVVAVEPTPELQVLSQRVKVLEHTLRDNVNTFTESEAALQNRYRTFPAVQHFPRCFAK